MSKLVDAVNLLGVHEALWVLKVKDTLVQISQIQYF